MIFTINAQTADTTDVRDAKKPTEKASKVIDRWPPTRCAEGVRKVPLPVTDTGIEFNFTRNGRTVACLWPDIGT